MTSSYMNTAYSALTGLNVIIGLFSSMAVNMPDFGRWSKNRLAGKHQNNSMDSNKKINTNCRRRPSILRSAHNWDAWSTDTVSHSLESPYNLTVTLTDSTGFL